jgi:HPt (histidine-containing phosphotransfer) domain-containing protein
MIPEIDPQRLRQIGVPEDPGVVAIVQRFVAGLDARLTEIAGAASSPEALARELHQLAGSAANCGFTVLAAFCRAAENDAAGFDLRQLSAIAQRATVAWQQFISAHQPRP